MFYLDLKSNSRGADFVRKRQTLLGTRPLFQPASRVVELAGTFLKLSEKGANRERSTIAVPGSGIAWFRELFGFYAHVLATGG